MPVVSVVMVFHRDTPYLRPAIASVLAQTFGDLELVLVDNGTGLPAAALGEAGADPRLRWVRLPRNEGIAAGHNAGVAAAGGEFIALLDYDDLALPTRLEKQVAALRADPGLGLVSSLAERIDADGTVTGRVFCLPDPAAHRAYAQYAAPVITPALTGRREVFAAFPYRTEFPFAADLDFQSRVTEKWRLGVLPEVLLRYRWHDAQTTQQRAAQIEQSRCAIALITARRRAGRPEAFASITWMSESRAPADYCRDTAARCLTEGFAVPAAYLARRSLALDPSPGPAWQAACLGWRAARKAPAGERLLAARMFLTGPVKALGLRPA